MKKTPKQIAAIVGLIVIAALIIAFVISAFTTNAGSTTFFALFAAIIALPLIAWLFIFVFGRLKGKHTMAEIFPESMLPTEEEIAEAKAIQSNSSEE